MNQKQKIIKYIATALALFLAFSIIAGVVGMITFFAGFSRPQKNNGNNTSTPITGNRHNHGHEDYYDTDDDYDEEDYEEEDFDEMKNLSTTSFSNTFSDIKKLEVESFVYQVIIQYGNVSKVTVDCQNVLEDYTAKVRNNTLILSGKYSSYNNWGKEGLSTLLGILNGKSPNTDRKVIITIPDNTTLDSCSIDSGTGNVSLSNLATKKLEINNGIGSVTGKYITADYADLECGTGAVKLKHVTFNKTDLESGTGSTTISGTLNGETDIESGIGSVKLELTGSPDDYNFDIEKGLGSLKVNGASYKEFNTNNPSVSNSIEISGGMGSIQIDFQHNS